MKLYFCNFLTGHKSKDELHSSGTYAIGWAKEKVDFTSQALFDSYERSEIEDGMLSHYNDHRSICVKFYHLAAVI